jgi:uncharacterized protein involved in exopolysaccharide biosynthesis/Mrp family chromosome partitioning ATPase
MYEPSLEDSSSEMEGISIIELVQSITRRIPLFLACVAASVIVALLYLQQVTPQYQTSTIILVHPITQSSTIGKVLSSDFLDTSKDISTEVQLIKNITTLQEALGYLELSSYTDEKGNSYADQHIMGSLQDKVSIVTTKGTNIVEITVTDKNPQFAADFANALAISFNSMLSAFSKDSKTSQIAFLEQQIPDIERQLDEANEKLFSYRIQTGVDFLSNNTDSLTDNISYLQRKRRPLELQLEKSKETMRSYQDVYAEKLPTLESFRTDQQIQGILANYKAAFSELTLYEIVHGSDARNTYPLNSTSVNTADSTRIVNLNSHLTTLKNQMLRLSLTRTDALVTPNSQYPLDVFACAIVEFLISDTEIASLQEVIKDLENEFNQLPLIDKELAKLTSSIDSLEAIRKELNSYQQQIKLTAEAENRNIKVVSQARLPLFPVSPNRLLILAVSVLLGGAMGVLCCLLLHMKDSRIRSFAMINHILGDAIPILGWTPLLRKKTRDKQTEAMQYSILHASFSYNTERYNHIVSRMVYGKNKEKKVYLFTSGGISEGKSNVVVNLGISLAQQQKRVLIIDADIQSRSIEQIFGLGEQQQGYLEKFNPLTPVANLPNLHIAVPGIPSAKEIEAHIWVNLKQHIQELREHYDYILIDIPPIEFASAQICLFEQVDSLLLCVRMNVSKKENLISLLNYLEDFQDKITGVIATGCVKKNIKDRYHYYGSYYTSLSKNREYKLVKSEKKALSLFKKQLARRT